MTGRVVCDASAVVSALLDAGPDGSWMAERLHGAELYAPALMPFECANIIRRSELSGRFGADQTAQAHEDLIELPVEFWPYEAVAVRVWELRANLTAYDAAYAALAELLGVPLLTLDRRIGRAPGVRCAVQCPPEPG